MRCAIRIVSLLPSATEIVYALGLDEQLVGVSHQCDYPPAVRRKPVLTSGRSKDDTLSSAQVDDLVRAAHPKGEEHSSPFRLDPEALRAAAPDLVLTQELCEVCALGSGGVFEMVARVLSRQPQIISLRAPTLEGVLAEILQVGAAAGVERRARRLVAAMRGRLGRIAERVGDAPHPRVLMLEWPDPPWCAGHWMADVARAAGGEDVFAQPGQRSRRLSWDEVAASGAEVVALMPCSYGIERSVQEASALALRTEMRRLPALQHGRFYALDGTVTSRHGARVVEVVEALASAFHPERCGAWAAPTLVQRVTALPNAAQAVRGGLPPPAPL